MEIAATSTQMSIKFRPLASQQTEKTNEVARRPNTQLFFTPLTELI